MKVFFFWSEDLKFVADVAHGVVNKDPDANAWAGGTSLSNSRRRPVAILFISSMRFGHFRPLDHNFSYNDATSFLYSIKKSFNWYQTCICGIKTRDSGQNGGKNGGWKCACMYYFRRILLPVWMIRRCVIYCWKRTKLWNTIVHGGSSLGAAEFCSPPFFKKAT